jgi:hypothetical protein
VNTILHFILEYKIEYKIEHKIKDTNMDLTEAIKEYLTTLTPKQHQAYLIAKDHLQDSFDLQKSNGFLAWVKKNNIQFASASASAGS